MNGRPPKRSSEESSPSQPRTKRNRYVSIACSECKRRKIKCNGETPCQRCGNLSLECLYVPNCCNGSFKESEEFRQMNDHVQSLQEQVNSLYTSLNDLRNRQNGTTMPASKPEAYPRHESLASPNSAVSFPQSGSSPNILTRLARFQGPTSSGYNFDVANSSLQTMGITSPGYNTDGGGHDTTPPGTPAHHQGPLAQTPLQLSKDYLYMLKRDEVLRLCRVYDEEMGLMYPMLDVEKLCAQANLMFNFMESAARVGFMHRSSQGEEVLQDEDSNILMMVVAAALTVEGSGESEYGEKLFKTVRATCERKLWEPVTIKGLILFIIVAQYYFHLDEEAQAYRITGLAARMCYEKGLHRQEILFKTFPDEKERFWVTRLFWSIYILDRRWSFGTGMPFAIQDTDIDPSLPEPDERTPYLLAMVSYGKISSKAWRSITVSESTEFNKDEIGYLDYQIQQWHIAIPDSLRFDPSDNSPGPGGPSRSLRRLRIILYLRGNAMRSIIYRPALHSATSIMENRAHAQTAVDIAKDTVRVLTRLDQTSDIYRKQQVCFNYFLIVALAVLFLAVAHAPVEFNRQVRDEFYMALDLVKGFSSKSYVSKRLWKTIRGLKEIGPKLGLVSRQIMADSEDPHSSAAVTMAGLAGHTVDQLALYQQAQGRGLGQGQGQEQEHSPPENGPLDGQQISYELTNLFEAAGGFGNILAPDGQGVPMDGINGFSGRNVEMAHSVEGLSGMFGNDDEFSRVMRDLF